MTDRDEESPIEFPCDFVIKVMGKSNKYFEESVINIILRHYPEVDLEKMTKRPSRDKNFVALTFTVHAENKEQLDNLYCDLTAEEAVLFAL